MPELPEVETIKIGLAKLLPGKTIKDVWYDWDKSFPNAPADVARFLVKARIDKVRRRAKVLIIELSSGWALIIHLKMTGQLIFVGKPDKKNRELSSENREEIPNSRFPIPNSAEAERFGAGHPGKDLVGALPAKSTRVVIDFTDGSKLYFNDQRKFGWMRLIPVIEIPEIDFFKKVGPEPLDDDFTVDRFIERLMRRPGSNIKAVLLDQTVIAGVGNIYADESLWGAKIHPATLVRNIPKTKLVSLFESLRDILRLSIAKGGSTDRNYVDAQGKKGSYLSFANVFRRQGQPCPRCGTPIEKIRVAGRGTHICPREQKAP
ncbi:MAG TPA: bifunctional DNA-formamidopyrimidine glycosylase/DNA-(apurinic or apyrimidinic site) lyase [Candidatus Saccharimonadales bacterium]|nr:bifunctional DNA-formamidopyrimidine glycosylase/DNA-(apurinic or apyrimidinic site) lyase [Candidatus Saccharimonadales bacterium]